MIIHNLPLIIEIRKFIIKSGWVNELRFFNNFIADLERNGDNFGFLILIENYDTASMRKVMGNYIKYSHPYSPNDSVENAHFNNIHAIDSAMAGLNGFR